MHRTILASAVILAFAHTAIAAEITYGDDTSMQTGSVVEDTVVNVTKANLTSSDGYLQAENGADQQVNADVTLTINTADRFIGVLAGSGATYTNNARSLSMAASQIISGKSRRWLLRVAQLKMPVLSK